MQGGRTLIIVGVVILVLVLIVGAVLFVSSNLLSTPTPEPTMMPVGDGGNGEEAAPAGMVQIVVAAQNIPRGTRITADNNAVKTMMWPETALPEGVLVDVTAAHGRIARQDIPIDMPITEGVLTSKPGDIGAIGSDAALLLPAGRVAIAMPVARWSSVAWAIQAGDHVDVMVSMLIVDIDQDFQTEPPHATWVYGADTRSDVIHGLGMVAATNHDHFDVEFARVEEDVTPPDPSECPTDEILAELDRIDAAVKAIRGLLT